MKTFLAPLAVLLALALQLPAQDRIPSPDSTSVPSASPNPNRLLNISSRAAVGTGSRVVIAGFITEGNPKDIVIRALGPSLQVNGAAIPGRLQDTTLELFAGDQPIAQNDDWTAIRADIEAIGFALENDLESAILRNLAAGAYSAIVRGKNQTTGVGLVEIYDLGSSTASAIRNLSTRAFTGTGDNVLIGGFIAGGGSDGIHVIIRVLGPSLAGQGITDALQDPVLELYDANGQIVGMNDNWEDDEPFLIQQSGLAPSQPTEAALIADLAAGNYTVIARGRNNTSGTVLLEFYNPALAPSAP